jgi:hypothetical protein
MKGEERQAELPGRHHDRSPARRVTADEIAQSAEFFSFGPTTSRKPPRHEPRRFGFLPWPYQELEIVKKNPFATIDQTGVGQLMEIAVAKGRSPSRHQARHLRRARRRSRLASSSAIASG